MRRLILILAALLVAAPLAARFELETVVEGLDHPWALVFLPDGRLLVTERAGRLRLVDDDGLAAEPIRGIETAYVKSQGGLMDIALHPAHQENGWIYLSLAHGTPEANATRLIRGRLDGMTWVDNEVLFTASPTRDTPVHYGGRLAFLPDGTLLLSIGDGFDYREQAQRLDSHTGSIVRLNADGSVPHDNPFVRREGALPDIFSYGHRNPQGLVVDRDSGRIWSHEHGPRGGDELNLIESGANYGWPIVTTGIDYSGARISPFTTRSGMRDPLLSWTPSIAPAGMAIYQGAVFPDWQGDLLIASLAERSLRRVELDGINVVDQEIVELDLDERLRDVRVSPDGHIFLLTDSADGRILRLLPIE